MEEAIGESSHSVRPVIAQNRQKLEGTRFVHEFRRAVDEHILSSTHLATWEFLRRQLPRHPEAGSMEEAIGESSHSVRPVIAQNRQKLEGTRFVHEFRRAVDEHILSSTHFEEQRCELDPWK
jgi:hypothetical protein